MNFLTLWWDDRSISEITSLAALLVVTVMLKRASLGIGVWALLAWPGTLCHELAHALIGFLLHAKPCDMTLFPKNLGGGRWQLGSVSFRNLRWWNAPWTAMAPLLLAPLAVWLTFQFAAPQWENGNPLSGTLLLALCAIILQASWPSTTDFRVALPGLLILAAGMWIVRKGLTVAWG